MRFPVPRGRLLALVDALAGRRLVVAGDFVLDRFVYGHPKRISREAPVLILRFSREENLPGGAGNTAANVRALGGVPVPLGATGPDEAGRALRDAFGARGIETDGLVETPGYETPTKTRILGGAPHAIKQQIVRYDVEDVLPESAARGEEFAARLRAAARGAHGAILSDYGYGAVSPEAVPVLRAALAPGARVCVDSRHRLPAYAGVDAATPNEEELEESAGGPLDSDAKLDAAGAALRARMGCGSLLVTRGSRGMALFSGGSAPERIPVHGTDQVADVTGAGDTVLAAFALALAAGATPLEAALLANFAGGVVVMKMGTAVVTPEELKAAVDADRALLS
ncbi:MAG TPA: PfkB family carbohydrate kinase [Thermoanaerobaculia bacterium]|nr:PfkB family carbohydrate kinase [Thermoanaerobaculia bacterium]